MLRPYQLALALLPFLTGPLVGQNNSSLWKEYGFISDEVSQAGKGSVHSYKFKDLTGALAAWESMRLSDARPCNLAPICAKNGNEVVISTANYVLRLTGPTLAKTEVDAVINALPD